jgi:N-acetylmuramoyl-L-alanine amidase
MILRGLILFLLLLNVVNASKNSVSNIRLNTNNSRNIERIVLDNSDKIGFNAFLLKNPDRLVIDLQNTDYYEVKAPSFQADGIVYSVRSGRYSETDSRLVFDLNVRPKNINSFYLKPIENDKHRIVIDLEFTKDEMKQKDLIGDFLANDLDDLEKDIEYRDEIGDLITDLKINQIKDEKKSVVLTTHKSNNKPKIIIDAGHGGKDGGATGLRKTKEKILTLIYAKALRDALNSTNRYRVFLTRDNDTYIELFGRLAIARKFKGDIFISIHADSATNNTGHGLSIFTLSQYASDKRTASLAQKENKSDIISGANLYGQYQDTINTLVDISRIKAMNDSKRFAKLLEDQFKKHNIVPHGKFMRKFANFAVLTSADMPSILLEVGFLSNNNDEKMIRSASYQQKIIDSFINALDNYFKR